MIALVEKDSRKRLYIVKKNELFAFLSVFSFAEGLKERYAGKDTNWSGRFSSFLLLPGNQTLSEKSHSDFQQCSFFKHNQLDEPVFRVLISILVKILQTEAKKHKDTKTEES